MTPALTAVVAAAVGAAGVLGVVVGRLTRGRRATWLGASLLVYSFAVIPLSCVPTVGPVLASCPCLAPWAAAGWSGAAFAAAMPGPQGRARDGWGYAASTGLLGAVHAIGSVALPDAALGGTRTVAVVLLLCSAIALVRAALTRLDDARDAQEEQLRLADQARGRLAERDHELRNGLAGLAGAVRVLGSGRSGAESLDGLLVSELSRLDELLEAPAAPPWRRGTVYDVEPVLRGVVALRQAAGVELALEVEPGLRATGSPDTLTQVLVNLVGNAERHAPGSPVRIVALSTDDRVTVVVRDLGPGLPPGQKDAIFERGVRDGRREGRGLGLHVCREILAAEDASIEVLTGGPGSGCAIRVDLPPSPIPGPVASRARPTVVRSTPS